MFGVLTATSKVPKLMILFIVPKGNEDSLSPIEIESREEAEAFVYVDGVLQTGGGIFQDHSHIIGKSSNGVLTLHLCHKSSKQHIHNQHKKQWGKGTTLADPTGHGKAFECGAADLHDAMAVGVKRL